MSLDSKLSDYIHESDAEKRGVKMADNNSSKNVLANVPEQNVFWICDGRILRNLSELAAALKGMNPDVYRYHVNAEKNDFANWVAAIIGDEKLAKDMKKAKDAASMQNKIAKRIQKAAEAKSAKQ
jgi:hypothetical protein